ncbi:amino acid ABC transporter substrate-binding protein [Pseudorhodoferax sp.]|uniref:amino acid ABC transporter substrate-binding protein n=1 Tax=Pseudorhodoferax sp. TaxID=1993553 RepID=UPI002DD652D8|nr:amino acid ABC transporter substrate-binding protein [Pseudorhodoferax sp.]
MSTSEPKGRTAATAARPEQAQRRDFMRRASSVGAVAAATFLPGLAKPAWAQKGVVKFGCSLPLTGSFEQVSKLYRAGYEMWADTVNRKIRIGDRELDVEWVFYDDEFNPARTAQLTERLITTDKVDFIVGTYGTDTILAQGAVAKRYNKITIQAGAASRRVDEEIGGTTTFTVVANAGVYPKLALEYLASRNPKPKRLATLTFDDAAYKEMTEGIKAQAAGLGLQHVIDVENPVTVQDLRPTVLKLKREGNIDIVYFTGHDVPLIKFIQEAAALDFNPGAIVGGHLTTNPSVKAALGDKLRDVYGVTLWLPQFKYKDAHFADCQAFAEKHRALRGFPPTYHSAMSYAIPMLYAVAAQKAGSTDNQAVRQALLGLKAEPTIWGPVTFNERGRIQSGGIPVIQWQGQDPAVQVISPGDLSTAQGIYPVPAWRKRT